MYMRTYGSEVLDQLNHLLCRLWIFIHFARDRIILLTEAREREDEERDG